jgi:FixJ family two-component response regulator
LRALLAFWQRVPGLHGPDLYHQIVEFQPEIKVLFMSGYAEGLPDMKLPAFRFSALLESLRQLQSRD